MPAVDPRVLRFLARHAVGPREAVEQDVAEWRGVAPEATWPTLHALGRAAAQLLALQPDALQLAAERDPPHPSYADVVRRLGAGYRFRKPDA